MSARCGRAEPVAIRARTRERARTAAKREKRRFAPSAARVLGDFERLERADLGEPYRRFPWIGAVDARDRVELERQQVGLADVAQRAAVADHRVGLDRLEPLPALEVSELVAAEVHGPVHDPPGPERACDGPQFLGHAGHELSAASVGHQRPRVLAVEVDPSGQVTTRTAQPEEDDGSMPTTYLAFGALLIAAAGVAMVTVLRRRRSGSQA